MNEVSPAIDRFFSDPILNSPVRIPPGALGAGRSRSADAAHHRGRRRAEFITPIPKPKKQKGVEAQAALVFYEGNLD